MVNGTRCKIKLIKITHIMSKRELYSRVGWRKYFDVSHNPRVERFLKVNGLVVFNQLLENIEEAIDENVGEILILVHKNAGAIVSIKRKDYKEVLEHSMKWFLKYEYYEQCSRVQKLLKILKKPKKPVEVIKKV